MGKIALEAPLESYLDRPVEDPDIALARAISEVKVEHRKRSERLIKGAPVKPSAEADQS